MGTRKEQAERTRAAVLESARELFARQGYDATSLQEIADAMGVTKAHVYYYFRTKPAILEALLQPVADQIEQLLDRVDEVAAPDARRELLVSEWVDLVVRAYRAWGSLHLAYPGVRKDLPVTERLDELSLRALRSAFGDRPTARQQAAFWALSDLSPVPERLAHLPDAQLSDVLRNLSRSILASADG